MAQRDIAAVVAAGLRDVPDFPTAGVLFKDITPLLADAAGLRAVVDELAARFAGRVDVVAGIEARGFIVGAPLAVRLGLGFVPVRKVGKLPGDTVTLAYDLEYGTATIEIQAGCFAAGVRVLVVDDVLATGGTADAACRLVETTGAEVVAFATVVELSALGGRDRLVGREVDALLTL